MKYLIVLVALLSFVVVGVGTTYALDTKYENRQGYDNTQGYKVISGYKNRIPYYMFFAEYAPVPETIKVQKTNSFGQVIQAELPINQAEEKIKTPLKRLDDGVKIK